MAEGAEQLGDLSAPTGTTISLPVKAASILPAKMGRRRALVLIAVHVLVAIHIAHWWISGSTITPLEPSEAMEFSKHRIINAGLIFFALSIVSTLVLGRWFCGWGCHLVALQDLARWLLGKIKIRPKPLRAGILTVVPLLAFLYMFIAPFLYQALGEARPAHGIIFAVTKEDFWATFPPWIPAIATLAVCGFVAVYLLGSKGFCTFGCPYGGIFGVADQLSPLRIRVTDDCEGTARCTATCSSNVRVHEEVRDFRMVVDPGCMKCLDCVSGCPTDALYFGRGVPALFARPTKTPLPLRSDRPPSANSVAARRWPQRVLLALFAFAAFGVFNGYDRDFALTASDWIVAAILTALALAIAVLFSGKSSRPKEYSLGEESLFGLFFLLAFVVFHGLYGMVAFLFALGLAAIVALLMMQALFLVTRANVSMQSLPLKRSGKLLPAAYGFGALLLALVAFGSHSGVVQYHGFRVEQLQRDLRQAGLASAPTGAALDNDALATIDDLIHHLHSLEGWSLVPNARFAEQRARLHHVAGRIEEYERQLVRACARYPNDAALRRELAAFYIFNHRIDEAIDSYRKLIQIQPNAREDAMTLVNLLASRERFDEAAMLFEKSLLAPDSAAAHFALAQLLESVGDRQGAEEHRAIGRRLLQTSPP